MPNTKRCGHPLHVQRYGGGLRYYCPECDIKKGRHYMLTTTTWTNAAPPRDRRCNNRTEED